MFRKWKEAKERANQLRDTISRLENLPTVHDGVLIRVALRSFDIDNPLDKAKHDLAGSFLDVSQHGYALHGRTEFGLNMPAIVLAVRTQTSVFSMIEFMFDNGHLGMCSVDLKHTDDDFIAASMAIEKTLRTECRAHRFYVPTWDGADIAFFRSHFEGHWISDPAQHTNSVRIIDWAFGARL